MLQIVFQAKAGHALPVELISPGFEHLFADLAGGTLGSRGPLAILLEPGDGLLLLGDIRTDFSGIELPAFLLKKRANASADLIHLPNECFLEFFRRHYLPRPLFQCCLAPMLLCAGLDNFAPS